MPWSLKAEDLVRGQYAAVGAAALAGLTAAGEACDEALHRGADVAAALRDRTRERLAAARSYTAAYRPYVWPVRSLADVRRALFQVLACSARTFFSRDHLWHMNAAARLAAADPLIVPTRHIVADLGDEGASAAVTAWWEQITGAWPVRGWWPSHSTRSPGCGTGPPSTG